MKNLFLTISLLLFSTHIANACDTAVATISGNLSTKSLVFGSEVSSDPGFNAIKIPLDQISAPDTFLSVGFIRVSDNSWRLDIFNDLKRQKPVSLKDYQGPISTISFHPDGTQNGEILDTILPSSKHNSAARSTVQLVIRNLTMSDGPTTLKLISFEHWSGNCDEGSREIYRKTIPDSQHDELNPYHGEEALTAFEK